MLYANELNPVVMVNNNSKWNIFSKLVVKKFAAFDCCFFFILKQACSSLTTSNSQFWKPLRKFVWVELSLQLAQVAYAYLEKDC